MPRKSKNEYPDNWDEIAERVKSEAGWRCVRCTASHDPESGYCLTVHHIDMDKSNCEWWNLAALCQRCHLQIQSKVIIEQYYMFEHSNWFKPYVAGYNAHYHGYPTDREYVMDNLDHLLRLGYTMGLRKHYKTIRRARNAGKPNHQS